MGGRVVDRIDGHRQHALGAHVQAGEVQRGDVADSQPTIDDVDVEGAGGGQAAGGARAIVDDQGVVAGAEVQRALQRAAQQFDPIVAGAQQDVADDGGRRGRRGQDLADDGARGVGAQVHRDGLADVGGADLGRRGGGDQTVVLDKIDAARQIDDRAGVLGPAHQGGADGAGVAHLRHDGARVDEDGRGRAAVGDDVGTIGLGGH
jgi:hypothetical protein